MEFKTLQENFLTALQTAARFISSKPQLPILNSFELEVTQDNLGILFATDLQLGIKIKFPVTTLQPGKIIIPSKLVTEVVSSNSPGEMMCSVKDGRFSVKTVKTKAHFQTSPAEDYPVFPQKEGEEIKFPRQVFQEVDQQIVFTASKDETRPVLTGVSFVMGESLEVAATDGYRLALMKQKMVSAKQYSILFPARAIQEISRVLSKTQLNDVTFNFSEDLKQAFFSFENCELVVRTLDGAFPSYQKIIPREFKTVVSLDRDEFEHHVKTALLFSRDISSVLRIHLEGSAMILTAGSGATGEYEATLELDQKVESPAQIAFNGRFVSDILQRIRTKQVNFQMNDEMKPGVFSEVGNEQLLYVVMPFRLNS